MAALGSLRSLSGTSRHKREYEVNLKFKKSRASFQPTEGERNAPVAPLSETSLADSFQLVLGSGDIFGMHCILGPTIETLVAQRWTRVSSHSFDSLIDPNVAFEPNAVKIDCMMLFTNTISAKTTTGHADATHLPVRSTSTGPRKPARRAKGLLVQRGALWMPVRGGRGCLPRTPDGARQ
ncbi:hypothetical protein MRX96_057921 [Rhipicephalus microplus]